MKYIHRAAERKFLSLSSFFKAVLLTGPRQTGKTTMLRHLAAGTERAYASLDDPVVRQLAKEDPIGFFHSYPPPVLIDEAQYAPELFPVIKLLADAEETPGMFWLTGSQHYVMLQGVQESLAGRIGIMRMSGLTQREKTEMPFQELDLSQEALRNRARAATPLNGAAGVAEHIWRGGLPRAPGPADQGLWNGFFEAYLQSYLIRDVAQLSGVQDIGRFISFVAACAALISQQLNYVRLAEAAGISQPTAKNWLALLQGLGVVHLLAPFAANELKRLAKRPKLYFADTGLAAFLTSWPSPATLWNGAMSGAFFENYVVAELLANAQASQRPFRLSYYRDAHGAEIDLILERDRVCHPLEIRKSATPRRQEVRKFSVLDRAGLTRGPGGIICTALESLPVSPADSIIPCWTL